jgi:hypothetical protein
MGFSQGRVWQYGAATELTRAHSGQLAALPGLKDRGPDAGFRKAPRLKVIPSGANKVDRVTVGIPIGRHLKKPPSHLERPLLRFTL